MMQVSVEAFEQVELDDNALDAAINAATEAHVAGLEPHDELVHGIKAYIAAAAQIGRVMEIPGPPGPVFNPSSGWLENYGEWYELYSKRWCTVE